MAEVRIVRRGIQRIRPWQLASFAIALLFAYLLVGYMRGPDPFRQQLAVASEGDLARILSSLSGESQSLEEELSSLKVELANLENASVSQGDKEQEVTSQLNALLVLAGTTAVEGPGIEVVIEDPEHNVSYNELLGTVVELRDAGAEAIAVNDVRLNARSAFTADGQVIRVDGVELHAPYTFRVIGSASTLEGGLKIPGGSLDKLKAEHGVATDVRRVENVTLPAVAKPQAFRTATPVTAKP